MTQSKLSEKVILDRIYWIEKMIGLIRSLPMENFDIFASDSRNIASAESYIRRCIEALLDLGRHIIAKGFGQAVSEYKKIPRALKEYDVLDREKATLLISIAGYRNRMVHFYNEISDRELFDICSKEIIDIENIIKDIKDWINKHPEMIDKSL